MTSTASPAGPSPRATGPGGPAATVEEQGGSLRRQQRGGLVEDAGGSTDEAVFRQVRRFDEPHAVKVEPPHLVQRDGERRLQGSRRRQPRTDRNLRREVHV